MPGLEHVPRRTADEDLAAQRLDPRELEIAEARLRPSLGEIARGLGLVCAAKDAQRDDLAFAAVHELVGGEARLSADLLGEAVVDASRQLLRRSLPQAIAPDARKHSPLPSSGGPEAIRPLRVWVLPAPLSPASRGRRPPQAGIVRPSPSRVLRSLGT